MLDVERAFTNKQLAGGALMLEAAQRDGLVPHHIDPHLTIALMIDRITEISLDGGEFGKGHVIAELDIAPGLWFFDCNFPGDPVMPGCLGLDAMWQIVGYWLGWSGSPGKGRAVGVGEVEFRGDIKPNIKRVRYEVSMRQVRRGKLAVAIANGSVFADEACVYLAKDMRVGLIASAI